MQLYVCLFFSIILFVHKNVFRCVNVFGVIMSFDVSFCIENYNDNYKMTKNDKHKKNQNKQELTHMVRKKRHIKILNNDAPNHIMTHDDTYTLIKTNKYLQTKKDHTI